MNNIRNDIDNLQNAMIVEMQNRLAADHQLTVRIHYLEDALQNLMPKRKTIRQRLNGWLRYWFGCNATQDVFVKLK